MCRGLLTIALCWFVAFTNGQGGIGEVPLPDCEWYGGGYGAITSCPSNKIPVSTCGSGKDNDCHHPDGNIYYDMLECCALADYSYSSDCVDYYGDYGDQITCPQGSDGYFDKVVEKICGSGKNADCNGYYHMITCCTGEFTNGGQIHSKGECTWKYGDYGDVVDCRPGSDGEALYSLEYALFGRCGSGRDPDCPDKEYTGAYCCPFERR